ncbi:MAG: response regulator [Acidobacteriota bacterium]|nr:response regulator [Acidobacteriota bacterium]
MIETLIVEDDYHVATIHGAYVRRVDGFEVAGHASTLASGRAEIQRLTPQLVLLDLYLPDGNGLDLLREALKVSGPRADFLVITAARDMKSVRAAMQLGAVHYLVKPFTYAQLEERLSAYRELARRLDRIGDAEEREAEQHEVDALYSLLRGPAGLPKGQSGPTMALIRELLQDAPEELSATEIAARIGISRSTAQRYLAELARQGKVELRLHYGAAGRPEHRYRPTPGSV